MTWLAVLSWLRKVPREVWLGLAALLLVWGAYSWAYHRGAVSQQAETAEVQTRLDTALDANKSNLDAISKLEAANKELAEGREADKEAAAKAVTKLETDRKALAKALAAEKNRRSRIYATDPTAAAIGASVVPDSLVLGLRNDTD